MWHSKSIMPRVALHIVLRVYVYSLFLAYIQERSIFESWIKELCFVVPNILVELRTVQEVTINVCSVKKSCNLAYSVIVKAQL